MNRVVALLFMVLGLQACNSLEPRRPGALPLQCDCCAPPGMSAVRLADVIAPVIRPNPSEPQERSAHVG